MEKVFDFRDKVEGHRERERESKSRLGIAYHSKLGKVSLESVLCSDDDVAVINSFSFKLVPWLDVSQSRYGIKFVLSLSLWHLIFSFAKSL